MASCTDYNIIIANKKHKKEQKTIRNNNSKLQQVPTTHLRDVGMYTYIVLCFSNTNTLFHKNNLTFNILMNKQ